MRVCGLQWCLRLCRPKVDISSLPLSLSTLFFETGFPTNLEFIGWAGWVEPGSLSLLPLQCLSGKHAPLHPALHIGVEDPNSGLHVWTASI